MNVPMRALQPVDRRGIEPASIEDRPDFRWIPLDRLVIDPSYQRRLSGRSVTLIRKGVSDFSWRRLKALNVVEREDGRFAIIDGQHTAIILLTHGGVKEAPCLVCPDEGQSRSARDFVALNQSRVHMTAQQKFKAALTAGADEALTVDRAAKEAGATILMTPPKKGGYRAGQTVAVTALLQLARRRDHAGVARILKICVKAELAPISTDIIRAVEMLLNDETYAGEVADEAISNALSPDHLEAVLDAADLNRLDTGAPRYRQIAVEVFRSSQ